LVDAASFIYAAATLIRCHAIADAEMPASAMPATPLCYDNAATITPLRCHIIDAAAFSRYLMSSCRRHYATYC